MKKTLTILLLVSALFANAQTEEDKVAASLKSFHQALVQKNTVSINQQTDKALSYGHSNGWVETKTDMIKDLETGMIKYSSFVEDSITVTIDGNLANARFGATVAVTLNGNAVNYHLKVLEVWVKKGNRWILFGRQAVR